MRSRQCVALVFVLTLGLLLSTQAQAQVCDADFNGLFAAINAATFTNEKDRTALVRKANEGQAKANAGKRADAVKKVNEIVAKTNTLASNGKITSGGDAITTAAQNVIACLQPSE